MAIEREILHDITKFKARLIGPLTLRQSVCTGIAIVVGLPTYMVTKNYFVPNFIFPVLAVICGIPLLCGFFMPYDMPLEKFVLVLIRDSFIAPKIRRYKKKNGVMRFLEQETEKKLRVESAEKKRPDKHELRKTEAELKEEFPPLMLKGGKS